MWRNAGVLDFVGWLRNFNDGLPSNGEKAGFYGLDLYSLHTLIEAVLNYLDRVDLEAARSSGVEIPTLCSDRRLKAVGACRLCLVEVAGETHETAASLSTKNSTRQFLNQITQNSFPGTPASKS